MVTQDQRAAGADSTRAAGTPRLHAPRSRTGLAATAVVLGLASVGVAALSGVVSRLIYRTDQFSVPWGLALGVAASASIVLIARILSRGLGFAAAGGWIIGTGLLLAGRPEGDYLLAQDGLGLGYLLASVAVVISVASFGGPPR